MDIRICNYPEKTDISTDISTVFLKNYNPNKIEYLLEALKDTSKAIVIYFNKEDK